jgi:drug/metabolite transporter (DMT)-like permease
MRTAVESVVMPQTIAQTAGAHYRVAVKPEYLGIAIVALFWGGYPLIARGVGIAGPLGALALSVVSLSTVAAATWWTGVEAWPSASDLARLAIAGLMMGIGLLAFNAVAASRNVEASVSILIMDTAMLLVSVVAAMIFFAEPITLRKIVGLALLVAGIAVLRPE